MDLLYHNCVIKKQFIEVSGGDGGGGEDDDENDDVDDDGHDDDEGYVLHDQGGCVDHEDHALYDDVNGVNDGDD